MISPSVLHDEHATAPWIKFLGELAVAPCFIGGCGVRVVRGVDP